MPRYEKLYAMTSYDYYYLLKVTLRVHPKLSASSVCRMKHSDEHMG